MIHANLEGVARTLFLTLRARADEQDHAHKLLDDPWSKDWYQHAPDYADYNSWYNPPFQLATVIRSRLIDEMLAGCAAYQEDSMVIELGSGLSTRYYRLTRPPGMRWVEQDLSSAITVRRKLDVETEQHWFVGARLPDARWLNYLPEVDPERIIFIAEGMAMFMQPDEMNAFVRILRERYPGATFILDVVNESYREHMNQSFKKMRAPMRWGVQPGELDSLGLAVQETRYLLLEQPDRWQEIGVKSDSLTKERSGFVVHTVIQP